MGKTNFGCWYKKTLITNADYKTLGINILGTLFELLIQYTLQHTDQIPFKGYVPLPGRTY